MTGRRWRDEKESIDLHRQQAMVRYDCGLRKEGIVLSSESLKKGLRPDKWFDTEFFIIKFKWYENKEFTEEALPKHL